MIEVFARLACLVQNRELHAMGGRAGGFCAARLLPGAQHFDRTTGHENKYGHNPNLQEYRSAPRVEFLPMKLTFCEKFHGRTLRSCILLHILPLRRQYVRVKLVNIERGKTLPVQKVSTCTIPTTKEG